MIVIVVIGILAAITIVSYNGIQSRARGASLSSALSQTVKKLALYNVDNNGYPATLTLAGVIDSNTVTYQYSFNNSVSPQTYCVTATNGSTNYKVDTVNNAPTDGVCGGHGLGGASPITNLARNPRGTGISSLYYGSGWFSTLGSTADTPNVSFSGRTDWHRFVASTGNTIMRARINVSDLTDSETYTTSVLVANSGAVAVDFTLDFCDINTTPYTVQPGATRRITMSASRGSYSSTYSFVDITPVTIGGDGLLITDLIVTKGTAMVNYADGNSPNWIWNGTPNASTSTGSPL